MDNFMSLEHLWKTNPLPGRIRPQELELDELDELDSIQAHKNYQKDMFNPCGHSGFESAPCPVCGYPDPEGYISILRTENKKMHKENLILRTENERMHKENRVLHSIRILIQDFSYDIASAKLKLWITEEK
jgi:hypothetical protein